MPDFAHHIDIDRDGTAVTLRFSTEHPANVITLGLLEEFGQRITELAQDGSCRLLVIRGRDEIFSGGADLQTIQRMDPDTYRHYVATEYALFRQVELLPFLTIAAWSGVCVGNAAELAMACDFRISTEKSRIGWPELNVAFDAPAQRLARFVGMGRAKEILFSARLLRAEEALAHGLLTTVVAPDGLEEAITEAVTTYVTRPPVGVRLTKENLERAYPFSPEDSEAEVDAAAVAFGTEDFQEGAASVLERRPPAFVGR